MIAIGVQRHQRFEHARRRRKSVQKQDDWRVFRSSRTPATAMSWYVIVERVEAESAAAMPRILAGNGSCGHRRCKRSRPRPTKNGPGRLARTVEVLLSLRSFAVFGEGLALQRRAY
ncbi:hypothetical protein [Methylocella sp.]|uniref:hypothetical protein n=1 Tax=Methylocella sp. TaxID=1978226 RepID=UPI003C1D2979